jgi:hypothetical protein
MSTSQTAPLDDARPSTEVAEADTTDHALTQARPNFWQQDWVQNLLPLITSVVLHVSIVVLMVLLIPPIRSALRQVTQEQVLIPDASFAEGNTPGGIPNPGLGNDPMRQARQDNIANAPPNSEGWADKPSQTLAQTMMSGGLGETASEISVIGPGAGTGAGKTSGIGQGSGTGPGTGDGSGALAPFGPGGGGGGVGPKFMKVGFGGNVRSIIFVCDASGSMMNKMATLKAELKSAVDRLKPMQWFDVVFFADAKPQALSQLMVPASPDHKQKLFAFLNGVTTAGATDPIPGLELAFRQQPQLIFLLTDGDFPDNNAVLNRIRQLNPDKKVHVNTIAFVGESDTDQAFIDVLKQIAKENGGVFKRVAESEVQ